MKILIYIIAGALCLGSVRAADPNQQGTGQSNTGTNPDDLKSPKKPSTSQGKTVRLRIAATNNQGKLNHADKDKKKLTSGGKEKEKPDLNGHTRLIVADDQGVHNAGKNNKKNLSSGGGNTSQTGSDSQGRVLVGNDGGIWRSGKSKGKGSKTIKKNETNEAAPTKPMPMKGKHIPEN